MRSLDPSELQIQAAIVEWLNRCVRCVVFAVPNAAKRGYGAQHQVRKEGLLKGAPDIVVAYHDGRSRVVFIEVKSKLGSLNEDQIRCRDRLLGLGHEWLLARSLDDVIAYFSE